MSSENITLANLEKEINGFFAHEFRKDEPYRFCLLWSQVGDLFHYLTHDQTQNPKARAWGTRDDEKIACGQTLMQLLMSMAVTGVSIVKVFKMLQGSKKKRTLKTAADVQALLDSVFVSSSEIISYLLQFSRSVSRLEMSAGYAATNGSMVRLQALTGSVLKDFLIYISARRFTFTEILEVGLHNQRDRDWAKVEISSSSGNGKLYGIVGYPGMVTGAAYVVSREHPLSEFTGGGILVLDAAKAEYIEQVHLASGVITDNGGKTSHLVNLARPLGIVCLVGTGKATEHIPHGAEILIDAADEKNGFVQILNN